MQCKLNPIKALLLVLSLMLLANSVVFAQSQEIDELIVKLGGNDFRASMTLQQKGAEAIPALHKALEDPDYPGHLNVIFVLDRMGIEETIPTLKLGLGFGPKIREASVKALVKFEHLSIGQLAVELLTDEKDYQLGVASMIISSEQDRVEIIDQILTNLPLDKPKEGLAKGIANLLATVYVEQDSVIRDQILQLLEQQAISEHPLRRAVAINTYLRATQLASGLGLYDELVPRSVSNGLIFRLSDQKETMENRIVAAEALALIDPTSDESIKAFVDIVLNPAADNQLYIPAVSGLEKAGALAESYIPSLLLAVENLEENLQWRLARVFVESGKKDPDTVKQIISLLVGTDSVDLAFYYARILGAIGPKATNATEQLRVLLTETKEPMLIEALERALQQIDP